MKKLSALISIILITTILSGTAQESTKSLSSSEVVESLTTEAIDGIKVILTNLNKRRTLLVEQKQSLQRIQEAFNAIDDLLDSMQTSIINKELLKIEDELTPIEFEHMKNKILESETWKELVKLKKTEALNTVNLLNEEYKIAASKYHEELIDAKDLVFRLKKAFELHEKYEEIAKLIENYLSEITKLEQIEVHDVVPQTEEEISQNKSLAETATKLSDSKKEL